MALSAKREQEIARLATEWVRSISKGERKATDLDRARIVARGEYDASEYLERIVAGDKSREILRAVSRAARTGEISRKWANGNEAVGKLSAAGLGKFDERLVFQNGLRTAYTAGQLDYADQNADVVYTQFNTQRDARVRHAHRALDFLTLVKGDRRMPSPPLAPNCRCYLTTKTQEEFDKDQADRLPLQLDMPDLPMEEKVNKATGERVQVRQGFHPGYGADPRSDEAKEAYRKALADRLKIIREAPEETL